MNFDFLFFPRIFEHLIIASDCKDADCVYNLVEIYVLLARPSTGT